MNTFHRHNYLHLTNAYCMHNIPLEIGDNLSYFETVCAISHKVNELIKAVNSQNLIYIDFAKMVELDIDNFKKYVDNILNNYEDSFKNEFLQFKEEINNILSEYNTNIDNLITNYNAFKNEITTTLTNFQNTLTERQEQYENRILEQFNTYAQNIQKKVDDNKKCMQEQQNQFEANLIELFNNFKNTNSTENTDFRQHFQTLFEQWQLDTMNVIKNNIDEYKNTTYNEFIELFNSLTVEAETVKFVEKTYSTPIQTKGYKMYKPDEENNKIFYPLSTNFEPIISLGNMRISNPSTQTQIQVLSFTFALSNLGLHLQYMPTDETKINWLKTTLLNYIVLSSHIIFEDETEINVNTLPQNTLFPVSVAINKGNIDIQVDESLDDNDPYKIIVHFQVFYKLNAGQKAMINIGLQTIPQLLPVHN